MAVHKRDIQEKFMNVNWGRVCGQKCQVDNMRPIVYEKKRNQPIKSPSQQTDKICILKLNVNLHNSHGNIQIKHTKQ